MSEFLFDVQTPSRTGRPVTKVAPGLKRALKAAAWLTPADEAIIRVAESTATRLDRAEDDKAWNDAMKNYLACLDRLGMTPQARARLGLGTHAGEVDPLDEFFSSSRPTLRSVE
jgi:hypothetical protein